MPGVVRELLAARNDGFCRIEARTFWRRKLRWMLPALCGGSLLITLGVSALSELIGVHLSDAAGGSGLPVQLVGQIKAAALAFAELDVLIVQVTVVIFLSRAFAVERERDTLESLALSGVEPGRLLACRFQARMRGFWLCLLVYMAPLFLKRQMVGAAVGRDQAFLALVPVETLSLFATVALWGAAAVLCGVLVRGLWATALAFVITMFAVPIPVMVATVAASGLYALSSGMDFAGWLRFLQDPTDPGALGMYLACTLTSALTCASLALACLALARKRLGRMLECPEGA